MENTNHFVWPDKQYKRDFKNYVHYIENSAKYLSLVYGVSLEEAREYVEEVTAPEGRFARVIPRVMVLTRPEEGHRVIESITPDELFDDVVYNHRLISPSMTIYHHPKVKKSLLSLYIARNVKRRSAAKKAMFQAERAGDDLTKAIENDKQTSFKINNNSLSGAHNSLFTILWLRSAHSTLTSTCRTAAGYANANNEKFLSGNRHYYSPEIVLENMISIVQLSDLDAIEATCKEYNIYMPTPDDVLDVVRYSSDLYWPNDRAAHQAIHDLATKFSAVERAAFVYVSDAWHLKKYNETLMRDFLTDMIQVPEDQHPEPGEVFKSMTDDMKAFVSSLTAHLVKGRKIKDMKTEAPDVYGIMANSAAHTQAVLSKYQNIIKHLWTTKNVPASVASFTQCVRRAGVVSDTDSTIFTVQDWCHWYHGEHVINRETNAIRNSMVYFASQSIIHVLAVMSANMGVDIDQLHQLAMKNEFAFPVFGLTSMGKHYFAFQSEREGNVYDVPHLESKGVGMKNSKAPAEIRQATEDFIVTAMNDLMEGKKVKLLPRLKEIGDMERGIIESINKGEIKYLTNAQIKNKESYTSPDGGPYRHYELWQKVFARKYGDAPLPPYDAIKVSIEADSPARLKLWLDNWEDQELRLEMEKALKSLNMRAITTMMIPRQICLQTGVPKEIVKGVDVRKLVYTTCSTFYLELESFGVFQSNKNITRLVSDYY